MGLTRTIKFEVTFPGLRKADAKLVKGRLRLMSQDLTRGANRAISALWQLQLGLLPHPVHPDGKPVPMATLASQLMNGRWAPLGRPCYEIGRGAPPASGGARSAVGQDVLTRIKTDTQDVKAGRKSLATFRELPIPVRAQEFKFCEGGSFRLTVFGQSTVDGKTRNPAPLIVRPRRLDHGQNEILHRIRSGQYKLGAARLAHHQRTGKWFLSVSWTDESHTISQVPAAAAAAEAQGIIVAGVDTGIHHACWISYTDALGAPLKRPDIVQFPRRTLRAVARISKERRERSEYNRAPLGLREGRGRQRKLRVTEKIGDKVQRMNATMLSEIAAATVAKVKARGATVMAIEDHGLWSETKLQVRADNASTRTEAARVRASYYRWHQGAMRELLKQVGEREGLLVVEINPAWTSRTCHMCGNLYKRDWIKHHPKEGEAAFGRVEMRRFKCECGYIGHADHNAAINIARRGIDRAADPETWNPRVPLFPSQRREAEQVPAELTRKRQALPPPPGT